ncbi:MAG: TetR/AcrR family transcriptional regulator [Oscillospiraceae bacterium]|nr:TetR/AcrR family transcriptional regulator [Oscillospiraceae bacterium]
MYHIKSDRRSQASAAQIVRGLQECLKTTPLKAVTVSDLHRTTGISRATFYRLFDTPEDVLIYQLDQMTAGAVESYDSQQTMSTTQLLEQTIALGLQNHEFLKALVENGRHDLLFQYTEKSFQKLESIKQIFPEDLAPEERNYVIAHLSMGMVASQITWARNGQKETAKDVVRHLKSYAQIISSLFEEEKEEQQ